MRPLGGIALQGACELTNHGILAKGRLAIHLQQRKLAIREVESKDTTHKKRTVLLQQMLTSTHRRRYSALQLH